MDARTGRVTILGDFFLHPEESIHDLEDLLSVAAPTASSEELMEDLATLVNRLDAKLIGFSARDLVDLYLEVSR